MARRLTEFKVKHYSELALEGHHLLDFVTRQLLEMDKSQISRKLRFSKKRRLKHTRKLRANIRAIEMLANNDRHLKNIQGLSPTCVKKRRLVSMSDVVENVRNLSTKFTSLLSDSKTLESSLETAKNTLSGVKSMFGMSDSAAKTRRLFANPLDFVNNMETKLGKAKYVAGVIHENMNKGGATAKSL